MKRMLNQHNKIVVNIESAAKTRKGRSKKHKNQSTASPNKQALQLAKAYVIQIWIDSGRFKNYSEVAKYLGLSRARVTQMADWVLLSPSNQEMIIANRCRDSMRILRKKATYSDWASFV